MISNNKAVLSEAKRSTTILNLELTLEKMLSRTQVSSSLDVSSNTETDIFGSMGEDGTRALCVLLKEHMYKNVSVSSARRAKFDLLVSTFVDEALSPMLEKSVNNEGVTVTTSSRKYLQRVVAS